MHVMIHVQRAHGRIRLLMHVRNVKSRVGHVNREPNVRLVLMQNSFTGIRFVMKRVRRLRCRWGINVWGVLRLA